MAILVQLSGVSLALYLEFSQSKRPTLSDELGIAPLFDFHLVRLVGNLLR